MDKLPFLVVIQQHLAVIVGGFVALIAFPFVLRWIKGWIIKEVGQLVASLLDAGDEHVDRLVVHALAVVAQEIPDNLAGNARVKHIVELLLVRFPHLRRQQARIEALVDTVLAALDERARLGVQGFQVVLLDEQGRTVIAPKK